MACRLNIPSLIVELDAKCIVDALGNSNCVNNVVSLILDDCRLLVNRIPQIQFKHCYRQANRCADSLARMSCCLDVDFSFFSNPLVDILSVFEDDSNGVFCSRLCFIPAVSVVCLMNRLFIKKKKKKKDMVNTIIYIYSIVGGCFLQWVSISIFLLAVPYLQISSSYHIHSSSIWENHHQCLTTTHYSHQSTPTRINEEGAQSKLKSGTMAINN